MFLAIACSFSFLHGVAFDLQKIIGKNKSIKLSKIPGLSSLVNTPAGAFLKNISIDNISFDVTKTDQRATGQTTLFGQTIDAGIQVGKDEAKKSYISLYLSLPKGLKFSEIAKSIGGPRVLQKGVKAFDSLTPTEASLILASANYEDSTWGPIVQGINFGATYGINDKGLKRLGLAKFLDYIRKYLKLKIDLSKGLTLTGQITPTIVGSSFGLKLPKGLVQLAKVEGKYLFSLSDFVLSLGILATDISLAIEGGGSINVPIPKQVFGGAIKKTPFLNFDANWLISFNPEKSELEFGQDYKVTQEQLKGFPIKSFEYKAFAGLSPEAPETLGLSMISIGGDMEFINGKKLVIAGLLDIAAGSPNFFLRGGLPEGMKLQDIIDIISDTIASFCQIAKVKKVDFAKVTKGKIPALGIEKAYLQVALQPTRFPLGAKGVNYPAGLQGDLELNVLGVKPAMSGNLSTDGLSFTGSINNIDAGPIKLTGIGPDKKKGTKDDGPVISFDVDPKNIKSLGVFIDGSLEVAIPKIPKASGAVHAEVSLKGVDFEMSADLFKEFIMNIDVHAPEFSKPKDWKINAKMSQKALDDLSKLTTTAAADIKKAFDHASQGVKGAQAKLKPLKDKADSVKVKLDAAKRKCQGKADKKTYQDITSIENLPYVIPMSEFFKVLTAASAGKNQQETKRIWATLLGDRMANLLHIAFRKSLPTFKSWSDLFTESQGYPTVGNIQSTLFDKPFSAKNMQDFYDEQGYNGLLFKQYRQPVSFQMSQDILNTAWDEFLPIYKTKPKDRPQWRYSNYIYKMRLLMYKFNHRFGNLCRAQTTAQKMAQVNTFKHMLLDMYRLRGVPEDKVYETVEHDYLINDGTDTKLPPLPKRDSFDGYRWKFSKLGN